MKRMQTTSGRDLGLRLIQQVRRLMVQDTAVADVERGFVYWIGDVKQKIWVEEGRQPTNFTLWKIHIQTEFLKPKGVAKSAPIVELANYAATLGFCALIPDGEKGWLLANTIIAHDEIAGAIPQMVCSAATLQFMHALQQDRLPPFIGKHYDPARSRATAGKPDPELAAVIAGAGEDGFVSGNPPPDHMGEELEKTLELLRRPPCLMATGDRNGICAEFPFGKITSMLRVEAAARHPLFLNCCSIKLLFQIKVGEDQAAQTVFALNHKEATDPEYRAHLFGSWCLDAELGATIGFSMFLPYCVCLKHQVLNLTMSSVARATWAGKIFTGRDWQDDFEAGQRLIYKRIKRIASSAKNRAKLATVMQRDSERKTPAKATATLRQSGNQRGLLAKPNLTHHRSSSRGKKIKP